MKISELIKELEEFKTNNGDLEILTREDGFGGYAMHTCDGVENRTSKLYAYECNENGSNEKIIKKLFPQWDGNDDSLDDIEPISCAVISSGTMLYAT